MTSVTASPVLAGRDTARFVAALWLIAVLFQRFKVPFTPVPLLLLLVFGWVAWGLHKGFLELDRERTGWWAAAAGATAIVAPVQLLLLDHPFISLTAWGLFLAVWAPFMTRLRDRHSDTYREALRLVAWISAGLAAAAVAMMAVQFAGLPYRDWLASVVPAPLLFFRPDYVVTYPIAYESPIYRANAFVGLEPSFVSAQIGLGLLAAVLIGMRRRIVLLQVLGLVAATSGSGFLLAGVGVLVLALHPARHVLARYVPVGMLAALMGVLTPFGQGLLSRVTEVSDGESSTSLRAVLPYQKVWPSYVEDAVAVVVGRGAGSSQDVVSAFGIDGLLVPTPMKILYDYGLLAGLLLAAFLLLCLLRAPSRSIAFTLFFSLWTLQPGTTTTLIVLPVLLLVTLWVPRAGPPLEMLYPDEPRYGTRLQPLPDPASVPVGRDRGV